MLASILRDIPPPGCVVDIGCGDGGATWVASMQPRPPILGIDWSADALRQARARGLASLLRAGVEGLACRSPRGLRTSSS